MKLEIGGGPANKSRGGDWVNIDVCEGADIRHDLNVTPWPLDDDSVDEIFSSHCLEHLAGFWHPLWEMARIGRLGATVEIRVPHPVSDLAMVWDHKHVFGPIAALNIDRFFPTEFWHDRKRLRLDRIHYQPSILLDEARQELPFLEGLSDEVVMKWIPRTCHECCFHYTVVESEFFEQREG